MKNNNEVISWPELEFTDEQNEVYVNPEDIAGYVIKRSPTSRLLFNVFGVDSKDELLFCAASDLSAEKAMAFAEALNEEYYPYVMTPTEATFIEVGGVEKVYNITTKG